MANHPLHPAIVHWPLALISTAFVVDALQMALPLLPSDMLKFLPKTTEFTIISYYALSAGLLTGLAAVVTGVYEAGRIVAKQGGIFEADKRTMKPKVKTLFAHAALNDIVLLASAGYWWVRRQSGGAAYVPNTWMVGVGAALSGIQLFAASLGGTLVYGYGAGIGGGKPKGKLQ